MINNTKNQEFKSQLKCKDDSYTIYDLNKAAAHFAIDLRSLPFSIRVLFENMLRNGASDDSMRAFTNWGRKRIDQEVDFMPTRVLMQDFTGVPAVVDLAAMRDAVKALGGEPQNINPFIPVDLVIDHSVQVDFAGDSSALSYNTELEFKRNRERYEFLRWGQQAFNNFKVVPPGTGICHQVNLEYLAQVVWVNEQDNEKLAYPDSLVGTDSHTTMINGLSVLGWGVGGIEAEAAMLGQPLPMLIPEVLGFKLKGSLNEGITATDLVLTITEILRKKGVVGKFVEFFGPGIANLTLADRATIANMAPEYGATCGFFPVDSETINYLKLTGRNSRRIELVETYCKHQNLWYNNDEKILYTGVIELDLSSVKASLAGPKRPQDRVELSEVRSEFIKELKTFNEESAEKATRFATSKDYSIGNGDVVIAAITSCTNTSNPSVMVAAGLVAQKAASFGLKKQSWVKASLAPGSQVVAEYLKVSALDKSLDALGFNLVGYGCTTCIGNSGPLAPEVEEVINNNKLMVAAVLSGNRNFEGRVHPLVRSNYLASPPLVVAYAIAGTINIDLTSEPIGTTNEGKKIYLADIWPNQDEIKSIINNCINNELFTKKYANVFDGDDNWQAIKTTKSANYSWNSNSTYINNPPYFSNITHPQPNLSNIKNARLLAVFKDSITTDHISPAGNIAKDSPAAKYLKERGIAPADFNSYGARRGNHEVMMRGTFANIRIKNQMCKGVEGGYTIYHPSGEQMTIFDAAMRYKEEKVPLVIFAGKEYGTGSSRDWAAKGTFLLGVKAVIAESFERIHRSNLVGMGVLPLTLLQDKTVGELNLEGSEVITIEGIDNNIKPQQLLDCTISKDNTIIHRIKLKLMIMTESEVLYIKYGSILHKVVEELK